MQTNTLETRIFKALVVLLAGICFLSGGVSAFGGINGAALFTFGEPLLGSDSPYFGFLENQYRFAFGVFFTQGLALVYFLFNTEKEGTLFRFVLLSLFIGGVARFTNLVQFGVIEQEVIPPMVIELVLMPVLFLWHMRLSSKLAFAR